MTDGYMNHTHKVQTSIFISFRTHTNKKLKSRGSMRFSDALTRIR